MAQTVTDLATGKTTEVGLAPGQTEGTVGGQYVVRPAGADPMSAYSPGIGSTSMQIEGGASGKGGNITTVRRDQHGNIIEVTERTPSGFIVFQRGVQTGGGYVESGLPGGLQQRFAETESQFRNIPVTRQRADYYEAMQAQRQEYRPQVQLATGLPSQFELPFNRPFVSPLVMMQRQQEREYVSTLSPAEELLYRYPPSQAQYEQITEQTRRYGAPLIEEPSKPATGAFGFAPTLEALDIEWSAKLQPLKDISSRYASQVEFFKYGATGGYRPEKVAGWDIAAGAYKGITEKPASFGFNIVVGAIVTKGLGGIGAIPGASRSLLPGTLATSKAGRVFTPMNVGAGVLTGAYGVDVAGRIAGSPKPAEEAGRIFGGEIVPFGIGAGIATKLRLPPSAKQPEARITREKPVSTKTDWYKQPTNEYIEAKYKELDIYSTGRAVKPSPREPIITSTEGWWRSPTPEYIQAKYKEFEIFPPEARNALTEPGSSYMKRTPVIDFSKAELMRSPVFSGEKPVVPKPSKQRDIGAELRERWAARERATGRMKPVEVTKQGQILIQKQKAQAAPKTEIIDLTKAGVLTKTRLVGAVHQKETPRLVEFATPKRVLRTEVRTAGRTLLRTEGTGRLKSIVGMKPVSIAKTKLSPQLTPVLSMKAIPEQKLKPMMESIAKQRSAQLYKTVSIPAQKPLSLQKSMPMARTVSVSAIGTKLRIPQKLRTKDLFSSKLYSKKKRTGFGKFPELANIATPKQIMEFKFKRQKL